MRGVPWNEKNHGLIKGREHHMAMAFQLPFVLKLLMGRSRK